MAKAKPDGEKKISQRAMVQAALDELGMEAKPQELQADIKTRFNRELSPQLISTLKSQIKKKGGGRGGKGGLQLDDLATVRKLVDRLGATQVKQLVDVLT